MARRKRKDKYVGARIGDFMTDDQPQNPTNKPSMAGVDVIVDPTLGSDEWYLRQKPSFQQERSDEEKAKIADIESKSIFPKGSQLHADYMLKKIQEMDMQKPECICGEINARHCQLHMDSESDAKSLPIDSKPDQAPREQANDFGEAESVEVFLMRFPYVQTLAKRVEQLEQSPIYQEILKAKDELAAAQDEIERLEKHAVDFYEDEINKMDIKLTQAKERIKELEQRIGREDLLREILMSARKKEQALEAALERIMARSHSWVITEATGYSEKPIHDGYREIAREALKAHKEGGE